MFTEGVEKRSYLFIIMAVRRRLVLQRQQVRGLARRHNAVARKVLTRRQVRSVDISNTIPLSSPCEILWQTIA